MRDKLYRFMQGRNGMDELARMQLVACSDSFACRYVYTHRPVFLCSADFNDLYVFPGIFKKYIQTL